MTEKTLIDMDLENYFAERTMMRDDFESYIKFKKEVIKSNYLEAKNNIKSNQVLDFNTLIGDTIKEKFESFIFECIRIGRELRHNFINNMCDNLWICASPEVSCIIETCTSGFNPHYETEGGTTYAGSLTVLDTMCHLLKNNDTIEPNLFDESKNSIVNTNVFYIGCGNQCVKVNFYNYFIKE